MSKHNAARPRETDHPSQARKHDNTAELVFILQGLARLTEAIHSTVEILQVSNAIPRLPPVHNGIDFYVEVKNFEIALIESALQCANGSPARAAKLLGLKPTTLHSKVKLYEIQWNRLV